MKILRYTQSGFGTRLAKLNRRAAPTEKVAGTVAEILAQVRQKGDTALSQYTLKFDKVRIRPTELAVEDEELTVAANFVDGPAREAFQVTLANVGAFAKHGLRKDWQMTTPQGIVVGERFQPIQRVGVYVPGGTAPLVSTAFMTVSLAAAAGVPEIVVVTPPGPDGTINPILLHALEMAGATEIYKVGGAQAIGALAYGTKTIPAVSKIFGPGNAYVTEAKRQVFGQVSVDLLAGPSEVMVLADEAAHPAFIAADLLAQAEHDMESMAILVTNSSDTLEKTRREIEKQAGKLKRAKQIKAVLANSLTLVLVETLEAGVQLANDFAPEHLVLATRRRKRLIPQLRTAGAIFSGRWSPVAGGDFMAGPSHVLPTGGAGKSFSGLTADMFQCRTSLIRYTREALLKSVDTIEAFSLIEGLDAHAQSARIRAEAAGQLTNELDPDSPGRSTSRRARRKKEAVSDDPDPVAEPFAADAASSRGDTPD